MYKIFVNNELIVELSTLKETVGYLHDLKPALLPRDYIKILRPDRTVLVQGEKHEIH